MALSLCSYHQTPRSVEKPHPYNEKSWLYSIQSSGSPAGLLSIPSFFPMPRVLVRTSMQIVYMRLGWEVYIIVALASVYRIYRRRMHEGQKRRERLRSPSSRRQRCSSHFPPLYPCLRLSLSPCLCRYRCVRAICRDTSVYA